MKLYVIRHGESENNARGCYTGQMQAALTEKGAQQARDIRPILAGVPFDKIYASDLIRACKTAENAIPDCIYETTALLREIDVGELAGRPAAQISDEDKKRLRVEGYAAFGGERREDVRRRVRDFLALAIEQEGEYIAAFSHAGFLLTALSEVLGISLPQDKFTCSNCTVAVFEYTGGDWRVHSWINPQ